MEGPTIWAIPTCHKSQHCNHDKVSESLSTHPAISSKSSILDSDSIQDDSIFVFAIENPCRAKGASTQCGSSLPDNLADLVVGCSFLSTWLFWRLGTFARTSIHQHGFVYRLLVRTNPSYISTWVPFDQARDMIAAGHDTHICISNFYLPFAFALALATAIPFFRSRSLLCTHNIR